MGADRVDPHVGQAVDRQALVAAAVLGHEIGDLVAESARPRLGIRPGGEVVERRIDPVFVDRRQTLGQMRVVAVVEQHAGPVGRDEDRAGLVVGAPDLHVGGVGRVARVDLIEHQEAGDVAGFQFPAQAAQAVSRTESRSTGGSVNSMAPC